MNSNLPPGITHENRVESALSKLLGHRNELADAIKQLFHQQQLHEERDAMQFERLGELLKGVNSRITKLEDEAISFSKSRFQSIQVKSTKTNDTILKVIGAVALAALGAIVARLTR